MSYRLLALDVDGTLVNDDLVIRPAVAEAVRAARAQGVRVVLATGRSAGSAMLVAQQLEIAEPIICYQGGMVYDPVARRTVMHMTMEPESTAEAVQMLIDDGIFVVAYVDERLCIWENRPEMEMYLRWHPEGTEVVVAPDLANYVREFPPIKLLIIAEPEMLAQQLARLSAHFEGRLAVFRTHALFGELTSLNISKGTALQALTKQLGIPREQVVAIGDQENDMTMVRWAGLGLAMGNAIPALKEVADAVVPSVEEDGVAWAIEQYVLKNVPR